MRLVTKKAGNTYNLEGLSILKPLEFNYCPKSSYKSFYEPKHSIPFIAFHKDYF